MATMKIRFNIEGYNELRTQPALQEDILRRAEAVAEAAGEGVEVLTREPLRTRARALVGPVTSEGAARVAKDNLLIRALEAGRE